MRPAHDLISSGCRVRPGHLPDPRVPVEAIRCPERRLRLRLDKQRPLRAGFCDHDHEKTGSGEAAEPRLAIRAAPGKAAEIWGWLKICHPSGIPARATEGRKRLYYILAGRKAANATK